LRWPLSLNVLPAPPRIRSAAPEERADLLVAPPLLPRSGAAEQADAPDAARREARGLPPGRAADPRVSQSDESPEMR